MQLSLEEAHPFALSQKWSSQVHMKRGTLILQLSQIQSSQRIRFEMGRWPQSGDAAATASGEHHAAAAAAGTAISD